MIQVTKHFKIKDFKRCLYTNQKSLNFRTNVGKVLGKINIQFMIFCNSIILKDFQITFCHAFSDVNKQENLFIAFFRLFKVKATFQNDV